MAGNKELGKTSTGMETNLAALLCYALGFVTGIIFYVLEKESKFVRFHAMQSIVVFGFLFGLGIVARVLIFIPVLGWMVMGIIYPVIGVASLILWVILMIKAYQGEYFKLPIAGDIAEKNS
jgi:uncharacterized membrane protein